MAYRQSASTSTDGTGGTNIAKAFGSAVAAHSRLVAFVGWSQGAAMVAANVTGVSDSVNGAWTLIGNTFVTDGTNLQSGLLYELKDSAAGTPTVTASFAGTYFWRSIIITEITGLDTTAAGVGAAQTQPNTAAPVSPNLTPSVAGSFIYGAINQTADLTTIPSAAGAFTQRELSASGSNAVVASEDQVQATIAAIHAAFTLSGSSSSIVILAVFAPTTVSVGYQRWGSETGVGAWQLETGAGYWQTEASDATSGGSGTTFTHSATGGVQSSGHGVAALSKSVVAAGSSSISGHGAASARRVVVASGSAAIAGSSSSSTRRSALAAGGAQLGGHGTSSTTRSTVSAGGALIGGHSPLSVRFVMRTPSGGATIGGAALSSTGKIFQYTATGGIAIGGHATLSARRSAIAQGSASIGGHAPVSLMRVVRASGGVTAAGVAVIARGRGYTSSGGALVGGQSSFTVRYAYVASGSAHGGGSATVSFTGVISYHFDSTGGTSIAGHASSAQRRAMQSSGGAHVAGASSSAFSRHYAYTSSGGATIGGHAVLASARVVIAAGSFAIAGAASSSYSSGAIIPAALVGLVLVFPQLEALVAVGPQLDGRASTSALLVGTINVLPD